MQNIFNEKRIVFINIIVKYLLRLEIIKQLILNLVDNAVNLITNGSVTVNAQNMGGKVVIHVKDTGIGFKGIQQNFERFELIKADLGL